MKIYRIFILVVLMLLVFLLCSCSDLIIQDLSYSPDSLTTGTEITFSATIKNKGFRTSGPNELTFKVGGETVPKTFDVPELDAGETYMVRRDIVLDVARNYQNTVTVDVNNDVFESREDNNQAKQFYTVLPEGALQEGNLQTFSFVAKPSSLLPADTRLGWGLYSSNIFNDIPNLGSLINDFTGIGIKRLDTSMQEVEEPIDWNQPEFEIAPEYDQFINDLNENGIAVNYMLHFWDKGGHANGETLETPRFKTEEQVQDFLEYVDFVVSNFEGRVQYYTLWSEPDACGGSQIKCIEPLDYIELARKTIDLIHELDPQAKVVTAPNVLFFDRDYLFTVLRSDIAKEFDVISWHGLYDVTPGSEFYGNYYYEYPTLIEEIRQVAEEHEFIGEYWATELTWCSEEYPTCCPPDSYRRSELAQTDKIAAKYDARGFVMHLGMDIGVGWGGLESVSAPWTYPTVHNLNTLLAGSEPIDCAVQIENKPSNTETYAFELPGGDTLFALWVNGVAENDNSGIPVTLTFPDASASEVIGINVLYGFQQELIFEMENGNLIIPNLLVRDYPIFVRLTY